MKSQAESVIYETGVSARADCPAVESGVNYLGYMDELPVFYSENYRNNNLNLIEQGRRTKYGFPSRNQTG